MKKYIYEKKDSGLITFLKKMKKQSMRKKSKRNQCEKNLKMNINAKNKFKKGINEKKTKREMGFCKIKNR